MKLLIFILPLITFHPFVMADEIHQAEFFNDVAKVVQYLINGGNPDKKDKDGNTLLHLTNNPKVSQILISHKAKVNVRNKEKLTPLHSTIYIKKSEARLEIAKQLLEAGANPNTREISGDGILHDILAIENLKERLAFAKQLFVYGANSNIKNKYEFTPLQYVNYIKDPKYRLAFAKLYFINKANPNIKDKEGGTPFHVLVAKEVVDLDLVRLYFAYNANPLAKDKYGNTPYGIVSDQHKDSKLNLIFLEKIKKQNAPVKDTLIQRGKKSIAKLFFTLSLSKKANKVTPSRGHSILHTAVFSEKREEIKQLLDSPVGLHLLNLQDSEGNTAMHYAVTLSDRETGELLMRYKPDLSIKNNGGFTAPEYAEFSTGRVMVEFFKEEKYPGSILHTAVLLQKREQITQLLNSSDGLLLLNLQNKTGYTAMHLAISFNDIETAELLMRYHPDLSIKSDSGFTARELAEMLKNRDMIELFIPDKIGRKCRDTFKGVLKLSQPN